MAGPARTVDAARRRVSRGLAVAAALALLAGFGASAYGATDPLRERQWGLDMVEADAAHAVTTGTGAIVAVIDSGVKASHADLQGRLLAGRDFTDDDDVPADGNGHGTHVAGVIAANAGNGIGVSSVAPGASILPLKAFGDDGSAEGDTDIVAAIEYAVAHGANVLNMSFAPGDPVQGNSPAFDRAVSAALDRGVVVVAAAGNDALPLCENGYAENRLLCVGAVDRRRRRSFYSSFGQGLAITAPGGSGLSDLVPGEDVLSTWAGTDPFPGEDYAELAGTSFAAPHVAGVAALLASLGVRGQAAVRRILDTATDAGAPRTDPEFGAGIVNARAAVSGLTAAGGGPPGGGGGSPAGGSTRGSARISLARVQRIRTVLRRGIRIRCVAAGSGRCNASARSARRRIAAGSRRLAPGRPVVVTARPTRAGRRVLKRALRDGRRLRATIRVTLPGTTARTRRILLR